MLLPDSQAAGTRGRSLQDGVGSVRIHGEDVSVRAHVEVLDELSAHAGRSEILVWLGGFERPPRRAFVVHGEPSAAAGLVSTIHERLRWRVSAATDGECVVV